MTCIIVKNLKRQRCHELLALTTFYLQMVTHHFRVFTTPVLQHRISPESSLEMIQFLSLRRFTVTLARLR